MEQYNIKLNNFKEIIINYESDMNKLKAINDNLENNYDTINSELNSYKLKIKESVDDKIVLLEKNLTEEKERCEIMLLNKNKEMNLLAMENIDLSENFKK